MNLSTAKERIRSQLLEARREMAFEDVFGLSLRVQRRLIASKFFRDASRLSLYCAFRNEVLTDEIFQKAAGEGKEVYYPRIVRPGSVKIAFFKVASLSELAPGAYDIKEPAAGKAPERAGPGFFDLAVVPGVAFDLSGARLGYGKGYYDRVLAGLGCPIVALAYEFQVLKDVRIPVEPHDVRVSAIVTEKRVIRTGPTRGREGSASGGRP